MNQTAAKPGQLFTRGCAADTCSRMTVAGSAHKTILIVHDSAEVRDRFAGAIEAAGHCAWAASEAADALARANAGAAELDLVIANLRPAVGDGLELIRAIRRLDGNRLPILVFSGTITTAVQVRALAELGVAGYVNESCPAQQILPALAPHLFPDSFNRRHSPRVVMGIPVAFRHANTIAAAVTLNLGKGGMAIRTPTPLEPGNRARIRFRLPNSKRDLDVDARVAWSDRQVGMGLEFERVEPADAKAIDEFVEREHDTN
jgi:two-component system, chemotaxis family, chemotaxis protein CheY